jgi:hypothetical protein
MRTLELSRTEAEFLIDLLEETNPEGEDWRRTMADELRRKFGCCTWEETKRRIKEGPETR